MNKIYFLLALFYFGIMAFAQTDYNTCGTNKISNSVFETATDGSVNVSGWTFDPSGDSREGWVKKQTFTYGTYLYIDRVGTHVATSEDDILCSGNSNLSGGGKLLKFRYNASNTGQFTLSVKLGTQTVATFSPDGGYAGTQLITPNEVEVKVLKEILSRTYIDIQSGETYRFIANNIWHDIEIYIPNYVGGAGNLSFTYERLVGASRQIMLDDVEIYDALPEPIPLQTEVDLTDCSNPEYDLTNLQPAATDNNYIYEWHTVGNNPTNSTRINDPMNATDGIYYLYISYSNCTTSGCYSPASVPVTLRSNCCAAEKLVNGSFSNFTNNGNIDTITGWDKSSNNEFASANITTFPDGSGSNVLFLDANNYDEPYIQQPIDICDGSKYELNFDFAMNTLGVEPTTRDFNIQFNTTKLFNFTAINRGFTDRDVIKVENINSNVKVYVNTINNGNSPVVPHSGNVYDTSGDKIADFDQRIQVRVVIDNIANLAASPTLKLIFEQEGALVYFDDMSLKSIAPDDVQLTNSLLSASCPQNIADLSTLINSNNINNYNSNYTYEWHVSNDSSSNLVENPTNAEPGTYYLFSKSCEGCYSANGVEVILQSECATITGSIYKDFDGASNGGINTTNGITAETTSGGGLFLLLVDSNGNVTNSVQVSNDGTYSLNATLGTGYSILLNVEDVAIGSSAPTNSTLYPSWVSTGETIDNLLDSNANGRSATFALAAGQTKDDVDFGIQYLPISSSANGASCNDAGNEVQVPTLSGLDDDPNFNNGIGQIIRIETVNTTNGVLKYNGNIITSGVYNIPSYDPALLTFQPVVVADVAIIEFTYKFIDSAGEESIEAGSIRYKVIQSIEANITVSKTLYCPDQNTPPTILLSGLNGYSPYTFTYTINGITESVTTNTGENSYSIIQSNTPGAYTYELLSVQDAIGCEQILTKKAITIYVGCNDADGDGITDVAEGYNDTNPRDTDNDGIADYMDLDSDNDGILDSQESVCSLEFITNGSFEIGSPGYGRLAQSWLQVPGSLSYNQSTAGGQSGDPNANSTSDLISATVPSSTFGHRAVAADGNQSVGGFHWKYSGGGISQEGVRQTINNLEVGATYVLNFQQAVIKSSQPVTIGDSGYWNVYGNQTLLGTSPVISSNLLPNDVNVAWSPVTITFTATSSSITLDFLPHDADSLLDVYMGIDAVSLMETQTSICDTDNDGVPDFLDLDSDNDGILDLVEGGNGELDTNGNGYLDAGDVGYTDSNNDGLADGNLVDATLLDDDNDGLADFRDPINSTGDTNGDGYPDGNDSDDDGILDTVDTLPLSYGMKFICYVDPNLIGTTNPTLVGISTLDRNMENNWVVNSANGFIKLESLTKGFVITRLSNIQINGITDPKEGMLIWSVEEQCLKLNIDGTTTGWTCISQGCNQ